MAANGKKHREARGSRSQYKGVCLRKDLRLAIERYRRLAKAILAGETEDPRGNL